MSLKDKYGQWALVAGASEGIGEAFASALAKDGFNLILIARRTETLKQVSENLVKEYGIEVRFHTIDLSAADAMSRTIDCVGTQEINLLIYNAAAPYIGPFLQSTEADQAVMTNVNMLTPLHMARHFGSRMVADKKGGLVLMSSLAGFHGSGFLSLYAATKSFNLVLAEGLWYEWKDKGVDVLACCAGATSTPNYTRSKPGKISFFAPKVQTPEEVVTECLGQLGRKPSVITGAGNRWASFFMNRIFTRRMAVRLMGDTTRKMYRIADTGI